MKPIYTFLLLLALAVTGASAQNPSKTAELTIKTEIFCDHCNYCESCKPNIENALFSLTGVKQVKLDIETQTIKVVYYPKKTSPEEIRKTVLASGYAADGQQPDAKAVGTLDNCCKRQ